MKNANTFVNDIMQLLADKYNNNLLYYTLAEKEIISKYKLIDKLDNINETYKKSNNINGITSDNKLTYINLNKDLISICNSKLCNSSVNSLLGYSLDYLSVRRMFPMSLNEFINLQKSKDINKANMQKYDNDKYNKTLNILNWVKNRVINNNFSVQNISVNKNTGIVNYITQMRDLSIGNPIQNITVKMDKDKLVSINGEINKIKDWSNDYNSLFAYFMAFGFNEIYCRCNCNDYITKYNKKLGTGNYMCSHILYSLCQLPYYMLSVLK